MSRIKFFEGFSICLIGCSFPFELTPRSWAVDRPVQVIDMRFPGPGIARIGAFWNDGPGGFASFQPRFAGDIDGDGYEDFLVGESSRQIPDAYYDAILIFGGPRSRFEGEVKREELRSVRFPGTTFFSASSSGEFAKLGDLDQDGFADFATACRTTSWEGKHFSGLVLLIFGAKNLPPEVDLADPAAAGVRSIRLISREAELNAGRTLRAAGDLNGDGKLDLAIGASARGTEDDELDAGRVYILYGGFELEKDLELAEIGKSLPGLVIHGAYGGIDTVGDGLGCCGSYTLSPLKDVNGDGYDDFGIGTTTATRNPRGNGLLYLLLGGPDLPGSLYAARPGGHLVEIEGVNSTDFGGAVASLEDLDGDGLNEILVAEKWNVYLIYGRREWPPEINIDDPSLRTLAISLEKSMDFQTMVAGIGDWNGDGFPDFIFTDPSQLIRQGSLAGKGYLVFGGPHLQGSASVAALGTETFPGLTLLGKDSRVRFGDQLESGGDLDGDRIQDFLVVSPFLHTTGGTIPRERSSIYVFFGGEGRKDPLAAGILEPAEGSLEGGEEVTLIGRGFRGDESVFLGGVPAPQVNAVTSAELRFTLPRSRSTGAVDVEVVRGGERIVLKGAFTYTEKDEDPDIPLDAGELRRQGYRFLVYDDVPRRNYWSTVAVYFSDLDADGTDDLIIGSSYSSPDERPRMTIIFGKKGIPFPELIGPGETASFGTAIDFGLEKRVDLADYLAFPGDLDGDGRRDLLLGRYLLFGREEWPEHLLIKEELSKGGAVEIVTSDPCWDTPQATPGDLEGDHRPDLLLTLNGCRNGTGKVLLYTKGMKRGAPFPPPDAEILGDPEPIVFPPSFQTPSPFPAASVQASAPPGTSMAMGYPTFSSARITSMGPLILSWEAASAYRPARASPTSSPREKRFWSTTTRKISAILGAPWPRWATSMAMSWTMSSSGVWAAAGTFMEPRSWF